MTGSLAGCTIIARNYLGRARVLARGWAEVHDAPFKVLVIDDTDGTLNDEGEPFTIVRPSDLSIDPDAWQEMAFIYDVTELATAAKPWMLQYLRTTEDDVVVYLDPDIQIFQPLTEAVEMARSHAIVLTPHTTWPMPRDGLRPTESDIMGSGIYNLGFLAVGPSGGEVLEWWSERLRRDAISDPRAMLFTDQRWMDLAPGYFNVALLRHPGYNAAYWNADQRMLSHSASGWVVNGDHPLVFFHFSGYDPRKPHIMSKHQGDRPRVNLSERTDLEELTREYGRLVLDEEDRVASLPYGYSSLPNGVPIDLRMRRIYRTALIASEDGGDVAPPGSPFTREGAEALCVWLGQPHSKPSIGMPRSRYLEQVYRGRPDVCRFFPHPDGEDAEGFADWVRNFGAHEERIPEMLIPRGVLGANRRRRGAARSLRSGIVVAGYLGTESGVGEAGRAVLAGVASSGIPYTTLNFGRTTSRQMTKFAEHSAGDDLSVNVIAVNADQLPTFAQEMGRSFFDGRRNVGLWFWEIDQWPDVSEAANWLDEIWVGSEFCASGLRRSTNKPVYVLPLPCVARTAPIVRESLPAPVREALGTSPRFTFLFCFDFLSGVERKNPLGLIEAFSRAFEPNEGPILVIKSINGKACAEARELVRFAARERDDIVLLEDYLTGSENSALMGCADCYVSLHRSEGYGLTMQEAMSLGKPVIATAYSGNLEFMTEQTGYLIPAGITRIPAGCCPYPEGAMWGDPNIEAASLAMRQAWQDPEAAHAVGARAKAHIAQGRTLNATGEFIRTRFYALNRVGLRRSRWAGLVPSSVGGNSARPEALALSVRQGVGRALRRRGIETAAVGRRLDRLVSLLPASRRTCAEMESAIGDLGAMWGEDDKTKLLAVSRAVPQLDEQLGAVERRVSAVHDDLSAIHDDLTVKPYMADPLGLTLATPSGSALGYRDEGSKAELERESGGYRGFEDVFRGPESLIRERQAVYLPILGGFDPIYDLGSGRGELLDILAQSGMHAVGIDLDEDMCARAREKGHQVLNADAVDYVEGLTPGSAGAIFSAQFIEHIDVQDLRRLLRAAYIALRPDGVFVAETVNPHCFTAFKTFWTDLSHQAPIFPEVLLTLCRDAGFAEARILFPNGVGDLERDRQSQGEYAVVAYPVTQPDDRPLRPLNAPAEAHRAANDFAAQ